MESQNDTSKREPETWEAAFLAALALTGLVTESARLANISREHAHRWRRTHPDFADGWKRALREAADTLEAEARRRALFEGSDTLLIFLLKGARPKKFRDNWKGEISGPGGKPVQAEVKVVTADDLDKLYQQLDARQGVLQGHPRDNGNS
jgi:hypothetical protein